MTIDFTKNHFELFHLPVSFRLDSATLDRAYLDVQREVHPDRFTLATDAEKRLAAQWATRANEGYQTLKTPLNRGRYFLKMHGIETEEESNTAMPLTFLMQQMEWREAVVDARAAKDEAKLDELAVQKQSDEKLLLGQLGDELNQPSTFTHARLTVRKLRFIEKLGEEIDDAFEAIER